MSTALDRQPEQLVPGGVELDLVNAIAEPVVGVEQGGVPVREDAMANHRLGAQELA